MFTDAESPPASSRSVYWRTCQGYDEFVSMVTTQYVPAGQHGANTWNALCSALLGAETLPNNEVDTRVHHAARALATSVHQTDLRAQQHYHFCCLPQPDRPTIILPESDCKRERGESTVLGNAEWDTTHHRSRYAEFLSHSASRSAAGRRTRHSAGLV